MNSLVSIVVPLYNKEEYIQRCIDSLLSQTYEHLEILIVDDGSTDRSGEIADAVRDERLVVIHQENRGLSEARNTGINHSSGEYLVFVDADDTVPKNGVKDLVEGIERNHADICSGRFNAIYANGTVKPSEDTEEVCLQGTGMLECCLRDFFMVHHVWATIYRRSFLGETRYLKRALVHEDNHFMFECAMKEPVYQTIRGIVYDYYIINTSYSRNDFSDHRSKAMLELAEEEAELVKRTYPNLSELAENQVIKAAMAVLANVPSRTYETKCISMIRERRQYFIPDSGFDKALFFLACNHLYGVYKLIYRIKFRK